MYSIHPFVVFCYLAFWHLTIKPWDCKLCELVIQCVSPGLSCSPQLSKSRHWETVCLNLKEISLFTICVNSYQFYVWTQIFSHKLSAESCDTFKQWLTSNQHHFQFMFHESVHTRLTPNEDVCFFVNVNVYFSLVKLIFIFDHLEKG